LVYFVFLYEARQPAYIVQLLRTFSSHCSINANMLATVAFAMSSNCWYYYQTYCCWQVDDWT